MQLLHRRAGLVWLAGGAAPSAQPVVTRAGRVSAGAGRGVAGAHRHARGSGGLGVCHSLRVRPVGVVAAAGSRRGGGLPADAAAAVAGRAQLFHLSGARHGAHLLRLAGPQVR